VPSSAVVDGLVAWYRFEDSTNTAIDATNALGVGANQTAFDGTVNGASFVQNGGVRDVVSGQNSSGAYDFDGVDDFIHSSSVPAFGDSPRTLMGWVNSDSFEGFQNIVTLGSGNKENERFSLLYRNNSTISVIAQQNDVKRSTPTRSTGIPFHLAASYDGSVVEVYQNGSFVGQKNPAPYDTVGGLTISSVAPNDLREFLDGVVDDVRLYNRAVSASEINQIYQNTKPQQ
jgi:hypothetical protein